MVYKKDQEFAVMVGCMDRRIVEIHTQMIRKFGLRRKCYLRTYPGGAATTYRTFWNRLERELNMVHAKKLILTIHDDCKGEPNADAAKRRLRSRMAEARKRYPDVIVEGYIIHVEGREKYSRFY